MISSASSINSNANWQVQFRSEMEIFSRRWNVSKKKKTKQNACSIPLLILINSVSTIFSVVPPLRMNPFLDLSVYAICKMPRRKRNEILFQSLKCIQLFTANAKRCSFFSPVSSLSGPVVHLCAHTVCLPWSVVLIFFYYNFFSLVSWSAFIFVLVFLKSSQTEFYSPILNLMCFQRNPFSFHRQFFFPFFATRAHTTKSTSRQWRWCWKQRRRASASEWEREKKKFDFILK